MGYIDCTHEQFRDFTTNEIFVTCFCYCGTCFDYERFASDGNGCVCTDCFCREDDDKRCRSTVRVDYDDDLAIKIKKKAPRKPVETVIRDLPEKPGKTGTCRTCKQPTYRKGDRGRFPVLCEDCK